MEKKQKILIVDDELPIAGAIQTALVKQGYDTVVAFDGEEGLKKVTEANPDLVLLDVMMPKMNGYEVCKEIKDNPATQFIPVVIVTALNNRDEKIKGIEAGTDDFLNKPVDHKELLTRIKSLLKMKSLHLRLQQSYEDLRGLETMKENLVDMIVHDMRNLLVNISSGIELLNEESEGFSPDQKKCVFFARSGAQDLLRMTNNLLDISKIESNKLKLNYPRVAPGELVSRSIQKQKLFAESFPSSFPTGCPRCLSIRTGSSRLSPTC